MALRTVTQYKYETALMLPESIRLIKLIEWLERSIGTDGINHLYETREISTDKWTIYWPQYLNTSWIYISFVDECDYIFFNLAWKY